MRRDPYEVLGVSRDAGDAEIKKTFRRLARELHPDVNRHDPEAEEKFKEAAEAYEILSDAERRATYDRFGFEGLDSRGYASQAHGFGSFADIFDAFFGGDPFGVGVRARAAGAASRAATSRWRWRYRSPRRRAGRRPRWPTSWWTRASTATATAPSRARRSRPARRAAGPGASAR